MSDGYDWHHVWVESKRARTIKTHVWGDELEARLKEAEARHARGHFLRFAIVENRGSERERKPYFAKLYCGYCGLLMLTALSQLPTADEEQRLCQDMVNSWDDEIAIQTWGQ